MPPTPDRQGEDIMLTDVLAFDVRVFDPGAPLRQVGGTVMTPSDFGWAAAPPVSVVGYGAYVDLGWGWDKAVPTQIFDPTNTAHLPADAPRPLFWQPRQVGWHPRLPNANVNPQLPAVYCTWSTHYESDGLNQDANHTDFPWAANAIDQGTNGLDDSTVNGVDGVDERETSPPYDVPLQGIQVKLRIYEPDSRQIRAASVTRKFE